MYKKQNDKKTKTLKQERIKMYLAYLQSLVVN